MRDQRKLKRQKTRAFRRYYRGSYFGLSCSGIAYKLAEALNRNNKDTLWWWCIGLADFRSCVFPAATPGHPPPADEHLCSVLHRLGMSNVLVLWHALLLERPVLLVSDAVPLLASACEALLLLLHPLRWECT